MFTCDEPETQIHSDWKLSAPSSAFWSLKNVLLKQIPMSGGKWAQA